MDDLAVIIVTFNSSAVIEPCLRSISERLDSLRADIVVVDAGSTDDTVDVVGDFPGVRLIREANRGFAYANNRGLMTCDARYVLFINPDTEILEGDLSDLVARMDERPTVGMAGAKQVDGERGLDLTIRRFPTVMRGLGDALSAERVPHRPRWLGERELDVAAYDREVSCDWTSGSFMLVRREAIDSAGFMDERFFMYSEETDFCLRIKQAGWDIRHFPWMTILHYGAKVGVNPRIESSAVYSRLVYTRKHFSRVQRTLYLATVVLRCALRFVWAGRGEQARRRRVAHLAALKTLLGVVPPPHAPWSEIPVAARDLSATPQVHAS